MIAMAIALNPALLIADEPTTALDVTVQAQVLQVMQRLQDEFGMAIILITHDLGVIADVADNVVVMYAGTVMEKADRRTTFYANHHPYTEGLLESLPAYGGGERERLQADPRPAAEPHRAAAGLPVPPALPLRDGPLPYRGPAARGGRGRPGAPVGLLAAARSGRTRSAPAQGHRRALAHTGRAMRALR